MSDKLTDAQVAALADGDYGLTGRHVFWPSRSMGYASDTKAAVAALAREVQQARQRRCGHCQHWTPQGHLNASYAPKGARAWGTCCLRNLEPNDTWSCADFTPKEAR